MIARPDPATGRWGQIFTLRVLGVSKKRPNSRFRLAAMVSDSKDSVGIACAYLEHRYTQQEVADHLGVRYSTISRRVRAVDGHRFRNTMRDCGT